MIIGIVMSIFLFIGVGLGGVLFAGWKIMFFSFGIAFFIAIYVSIAAYFLSKGNGNVFE